MLRSHERREEERISLLIKKWQASSTQGACFFMAVFAKIAAIRDRAKWFVTIRLKRIKDY